MSRSAIILDYARPVPLLQRPRIIVTGVMLALAAAASLIYATSPIRTPGFGGARLVPLQLQYPRPVFYGTPSPIWNDARSRLSNLEISVWGPPGTFLVPVGCTNLALNKPVTGSDPHPIIGDHSMVTDGNAEGTEMDFVEIAPGLQWVQIDLGAPARLYAIALWHKWVGPEVYYDVVVQVSNDPQFTSGVTTLFNNDDDNSSGLGVGKDPMYFETHLGRIIAARGALARYVRLYSKGGFQAPCNTYAEVEVHGLPAGSAVPSLLQALKPTAATSPRQ